MVDHTAVNRSSYLTAIFAGRYFHTVIGDKIVHHFHPVEEVFLFERLAPEIKPNSIKDFFVLDSGEVGFLVFFVVFFLKLATPLKRSSKPVEVANTMGFRVMPPATGEVIVALPATMLQSRFLTLKAAVQLLVVVMFLVVVHG